MIVNLYDIEPTEPHPQPDHLALCSDREPFVFICNPLIIRLIIYGQFIFMTSDKDVMHKMYS